MAPKRPKLYPKGPLTEKELQALAPRAKAYKVFDKDGLFVLVHPNGGKYWRFKYYLAGKERIYAIGTYPEISLKQARQETLNLRAKVRGGADPAIEKQLSKKRLQVDHENTFEAVARHWHEYNLGKWKPKTAVDILHRLEKDVFPVIGKLPMATIKPVTLLHMLQNQFESRGAHEMARRAKQYCQQIFDYAVTREIVENNPARTLKGGLKPYTKGHYAALDARDLPEFIANLRRNDARLFPQTRLAIELLMLTFVRTSELINARWDEFDFAARQWIIPQSRMKMKRDHLVPLSRQSLEILARLREMAGHSTWVLPSHVKPIKPISNNTILKAIGAMGYKGRMTGHGFRALAMSTIKEKLGYRHETVDRQLAHAQKSQIAAAYDRAQFLDERTRMMQEWADYLQEVEHGKNA